MKKKNDLHTLYSQLEKAHRQFLKIDGQLMLLQQKRDKAYREWVDAKEKVRFLKTETAVTPFPDTPDSVQRVERKPLADILPLEKREASFLSAVLP